jgi:DNA-binding NtrC family response regulator
MFSGKVDDDSLSKATSRGARGFIGKPFDLQHLIDQTKHILPPQQ